MNVDLGKPPDFAPCPSCGEQTTGGGDCFDCVERKSTLAGAVRLTESRIPEGYAAATLTAAWLRALVGAERVARAESALGAKRVLLHGPSASGKTSLAVAMLRAWTRLNAKPGLFCLATELATARQRARFGVESEEIAAAKYAPLLVLDELGPDEFKAPASPVTDVVFYRHAHARPTWVTTWMTHEERVARYGDGFERRLVEGARIIACGATR